MRPPSPRNRPSMVKDSVEVIRLRKANLFRSQPTVTMESALNVGIFNVIPPDSLLSPASALQYILSGG